MDWQVVRNWLPANSVAKRRRKKYWLSLLFVDFNGNRATVIVESIIYPSFWMFSKISFSHRMRYPDGAFPSWYLRCVTKTSIGFGQNNPWPGQNLIGSKMRRTRNEMNWKSHIRLETSSLYVLLFWSPSDVLVTTESESIILTDFINDKNVNIRLFTAIEVRL